MAMIQKVHPVRVSDLTLIGRWGVIVWVSPADIVPMTAVPSGYLAAAQYACSPAGDCIHVPAGALGFGLVLPWSKQCCRQCQKPAC
jgi:hypothetical protein